MCVCSTYYFRGSGLDLLFFAVSIFLRRVHSHKSKKPVTRLVRLAPLFEPEPDQDPEHAIPNPPNMKPKDITINGVHPTRPSGVSGVTEFAWDERGKGFGLAVDGFDNIWLSVVAETETGGHGFICRFSPDFPMHNRTAPWYSEMSLGPSIMPRGLVLGKRGYVLCSFVVGVSIFWSAWRLSSMYLLMSSSSSVCVLLDCRVLVREKMCFTVY